MRPTPSSSRTSLEARRWGASLCALVHKGITQPRSR
jgi:hypothetical protein